MIRRNPTHKWSAVMPPKLYNLIFVSHDPFTLLLLGWALCVPLYFILQTWFGFAWIDRWRTVALIPLIGLALTEIGAFVLTLTFADQLEFDSHDPSALFGLVFAAGICFAPLGFIYLVIAGITRLVAKKN
jgi:hypothetical protein